MASEYYKFFHIVFVLIFFSGVIVSMMSMIRAQREPNIHTVRTLVRTADHAGLFMVTLPLILTGVFGILTAWQQKIPLTDTGWLNAAYGATIVMFVAGGVVFGGQTRRAVRLADRDVPQDAKSPEIQAVLSSPIPRIAGPLLMGLMIYIIVLMVFQPF